MNEKILIIDFGSQYTQLIARKVREHNVYCEIHPYNNIPKFSKECKGIILSGSPYSVRNEDAPDIDIQLFRNQYPILAICYGAQLLSHKNGGIVLPSKIREYGRANLSFVDNNSKLLTNVTQNSQVWMSHGDTISSLPQNFNVICSTKEVKVAGFKIENEETYGIQFHPEVYHSSEGVEIIRNFLINIAQCKCNWTSDSFIETAISEIKSKVGNDNVILGISGGVDSSVASILLSKAIGNQLYCIFIDNGLLRKNEYNKVLESYKNMGLNIIGVNAKELFYNSLKGITEPEAKRKAIGKTFIDVFDMEAKKIKNVVWLAQGTIYPDVIESISVKGPSATIKSHHNVGGLPDFMKLKIIEPLNTLFKDEVRKVGYSLNMPKHLLNRHPFPGPGLGIRILGEITPEKVSILQEVDEIYLSILEQTGWYEQIWQAGAIFLPIQSVGVMGDERTYENVIALRAVSSTDGMTADWVHIPYNILSEISNAIINKVKGVNRVVYDISSKPPATIEWE